MANTRWAELLIKKVRKDKNGRIVKILVGIDVINSIKGDVELTIIEIINLIRNGAIIKTVYLNENNNWVEGQLISSYIDNNGVKRIKTDSNDSEIDNLENLPIF